MKKILLLTSLFFFCSVHAQQGVLPGKFSVSPDKQVQFSQGYLQYNAAQGKHKCADGSTQKGTWRFASSQMEFIGESNTRIAQDYDGWIDLLGWGASGYNGRQPWMYVRQRLSDVPASDDPAMYDYGVYNAISNGGNKPGLWRCLTAKEWKYLLEERDDAQNLQGIVKIDGVQGLLLLPDVHNEKEYRYVIAQDDIPEDQPAFDIFDLDEIHSYTWKKIESRGAVFLPLAGMMRQRDGEFRFREWISGSWAAPYDASQNKIMMGGCNFDDDDKRAEVSDYDNVHSHCPVRLVWDPASGKKAKASAKPKKNEPKEYTDQMLSMQYPANYTPETTDEGVSFNRADDASNLSIFSVYYQCLAPFENADKAQAELALKASCVNVLTRIEKQYKTFKGSEPAHENKFAEPTYSCTYTATTGNGKSVKGFYMATLHNGCMFIGLIQHEDAKEYARLVPYLYTLCPMNKPKQAQTTVQREESKQNTPLPTVLFTKTYTKDNLSFTYPKDLVVTDSESESETQVSCNYIGGGTAVMNLNFTRNTIFLLVEKGKATDICKSSVEEMYTNLGKIYTDLTCSEIQTDSDLPNANAYMTFTGKLMGMNMCGRLDASLIGDCYVVTVMQAETEDLLQLLRSVRQTLKITLGK